MFEHKRGVSIRHSLADRIIRSLDLGRLFKPLTYLLDYISARRWLSALVDDAVPYLYRLAEAGTREEARQRIRKFLGK